MKKLWFKKIMMLVTSLLLLLMPAIVFAQSGEIKLGAPPVGQPLVSEGSFAVELVSKLGVSTTNDEVEAESQLGDIGIAPRNGWIADYPVTPDIVVELQNAVASAAAADKLSMSRDEALKKLNDVTIGFGLPVRPYSAGTPYEPSAKSCEVYPNPMAINNTYTSEGPPVVTYYCPPPDYYYLYAWVPSPFWWSDLWFPGFFILNDFHRIIHHHQKVVFITNHFNHFRNHRVFRIDPVERFRGKTFGGIGVTRTKNFISTGVPRSERTIFNGPHAIKAPVGTMVTPPAHFDKRMSAPSGIRSGSPLSTGRSSFGRGGRR